MRGILTTGFTTGTVVAAGLVTALSTVAAAPSASAAPVPTSTLRFAAGATSGTVSGHLAAGGVHRYVFGASRGQTATVRLTRSSPTARWTLVSSVGEVLHSQTGEDSGPFVVELDATGPYWLDVLTTDPTDYVLDVGLPVEVRFAPGTSSATVSGRLGAGSERAYTFDARAGQTARVRFARSDRHEGWVLTAPDGTALHTLVSGYQSAADLRLPATGTYTLEVMTGGAATYRLGLAIPAR